MTYNRTELDGANLFGAALDPLPAAAQVDGAPGLAIWRSFSHPPCETNACGTNRQSYVHEPLLAPQAR